MGIIEEKLKLLPSNPGVYIMLNGEGKVIYVGKAKNLKNRVRQYFHDSVKTQKVMAMVSNVADFSYVITPTEIDALSLENNLIKKHKPRYNVLLKDDKTYPYLRIDLKDDFPTLTVERRLKKDGAKYFGPFMGGISVRDVIYIANYAFNLRPCVKKLNSKPQKPCLNYHIGKCLSPCAGLVSKEEYAKSVKSAIEFLSGETDVAERILKERMFTFSEREDFEQALKCRELLASLEKLKLTRLTSLNKFIDADVIAYKANGIYSVINMLIVRKGRMLGAKNFSLTDYSSSDEEALSSFISGYYSDNIDIPSEIITTSEPLDVELLETYLKEKAGKSVTILSPKIGVKRQLLDMAEVNATEHLEIAVDRIKHKEDMTISACESLKNKLNLKNYPRRMECYDISNVSGVDKVGSMVVFIDGEADKKSYRRFKIKTFEGADDYRSHQEMMRRRLERLSTDIEKFPKPDLIVIDGGKGQLSSVKEVFDEFNITDIDLIALAEREEEIFLIGNPNPILLEKRDYCLKMLQRLRDEAHRFAITYHRTLRGKRALSSVLDGIEGIGKVKRQALINKFKDVSGIALASIEEIATVDGISKRQAKIIKDKLKEEGII